MTFSQDGARAYVASITHSDILDTSDPAAPAVLSLIIDPAITIQHQADPITVDTALGPRTFLIISDETAGAAGNGFCPGGGLHVYDITGELELRPVKAGACFLPDVAVQEGAPTGVAGTVTRTAHVFRAYDEQDVMTISAFAGGVRVLDLSGLAGAAGISVGVSPDTPSTGEVAGLRDLGSFRFTTTHDIWAAKAHPDRFAEDGSFYFFSNDQTRGFDGFHFEATAAAGDGAELGRWASPAQALQRARQRDLTAPEGRLLTPACVLAPDAAQG